MRRRLVALLPLIVLVSALGATAPAHAAPDDDILDVTGVLLDSRTDPAEPVPGVTVSVEIDGAPVGQAVSDAEGSFNIPLPGEQADLVGETIVVKLDTDSLPTDTTLTEEGDNVRELVIKTDSDIRIGYRIGPEQDQSSEILRRAAQSGLNGVFLGLLLALAALGLSLVFGTTGLTNFAHGELITFGAIMVFWMQSGFSMPFLPAVAVAVVLSGVFGYANDTFLWRPLRNRGTGLLAMMIVSIGLSIFVRYLFQYFAGANSENFDNVNINRRPIDLGPIGLSTRLFWTGVICVIVLVLVSIAVQRTRLGKAIRAVADNPPLAASSGIDVDRVILTVWIAGAALAGGSGILWGMNYGFDYQFGFKILLLVFAAVILGGLGTIWGTMVGAILVGLMIEMSSLFLPAEMKYVTALVVLIVVLLIRPQGILGRAERVG